MTLDIGLKDYVGRLQALALEIILDDNDGKTFIIKAIVSFVGAKMSHHDKYNVRRTHWPRMNIWSFQLTVFLLQKESIVHIAVGFLLQHAY